MNENQIFREAIRKRELKYARPVIFGAAAGYSLWLVFTRKLVAQGAYDPIYGRLTISLILIALATSTYFIRKSEKYISFILSFCIILTCTHFFYIIYKNPTFVSFIGGSLPVILWAGISLLFARPSIFFFHFVYIVGLSAIVAFTTPLAYPELNFVGQVAVTLLGAYFANRNNRAFAEDLIEQQLLSHKKDKLASLGTLAVSIGHEINSPLTVLTGNLEYCVDCKDKANKQRLFSAVNRMNTIVRNLLNFTTTKSFFTEINANDEITNLLDFVKPMIDKSYCNVVTEFKSELALFKGDSQRFQQIMINLINHAKESFGDTINPTIVISTYDDNENVYVEVKDNGSGFHDHELKDFFNPYLNRSNSQFGLYISKKLATEMQSDLSIESKKNHGTTLRFKTAKLLDQSEDQ